VTDGRNLHLPLPTLTEPGLVLRPRRLEDADALTAACQDPEIVRWTRVPSPYTREDALEFIARDVIEAQAGEAVGLVAVDEDDRLLGSISIMDLLSTPGYGEIGYWVAAGARGRGVATRAVRLLTAWGHAELGLDRLEVHVHKDNELSHRVPLAAGYERLPGLFPSERLGMSEPVFARYVSRGR
jgi:RimJ/RimL family protein N-acetyltransferase